MNENTEENVQTVKVKVEPSDIVIATTVVVVTVGVLHVAACVVLPPLRKLTRKLEKKNEELKTK
jgi:hypothetical protein